MMPAAKPRDERRVEPPSAPHEHARAARFDVCLRFGAAIDATRYLQALASLFFGACTKVTATLTTGASRDDLTVEEVVDRLSRHVIQRLLFTFPLGGEPLSVELRLLPSEPDTVAIRAPFSSAPPRSRLWLQSDADGTAPISVLALPTTDVALALDAAHALIGLAVRSGGIQGS